MSSLRESQPAPVDPDRDHVRGDGAHTLLVYGDYECADTRAAYRTAERLQHEGVAFRFAFRQFPLTEIHLHALQAAVAAEAAHEQGRFWPMHDLLFDHQDALGRDDLRAYAGAAGLDLERFDRDFGVDAQLARIEADVRGGLEVGVHGTPTLFVDGARHHGHDPAELRAALTA